MTKPISPAITGHLSAAIDECLRTALANESGARGAARAAVEAAETRIHAVREILWPKAPVPRDDAEIVAEYIRRVSRKGGRP